MTIAYMYGNFLKCALNKEVDIDTDTIRCILVNGYTFNKDTHIYKNAITTNELPTGSGYTANGIPITISLTYDSATDKVKVTASTNPSWSNTSITATGAILFDDTPANKPLILYIDFEGAKTSVAGTFQITWDVNGIFEFPI